jgi:hypothetical protein
VVPQRSTARGPPAGTAGEIRGEAQPVQARTQHIGWARLLNPVFDIDLRRCPSCGARALKIIAAILQRAAIEKILTPRGFPSSTDTRVTVELGGPVPAQNLSENTSGLFAPRRKDSEQAKAHKGNGGGSGNPTD